MNLLKPQLTRRLLLLAIKEKVHSSASLTFGRNPSSTSKLNFENSCKEEKKSEFCKKLTSLSLNNINTLEKHNSFSSDEDIKKKFSTPKINILVQSAEGSLY
jgi:tyrosyl-tRNA synthetase